MSAFTVLPIVRLVEMIFLAKKQNDWIAKLGRLLYDLIHPRLVNL